MRAVVTFVIGYRDNNTTASVFTTRVIAPYISARSETLTAHSAVMRAARDSGARQENRAGEGRRRSEGERIHVSLPAAADSSGSFIVRRAEEKIAFTLGVEA